MWEGIPFFNQHLVQVSQCGHVGQSGMNSTPKLIPQLFSEVEVMTVERPFHPLDSQILEVASDKAHSVEESVVILEDEVQSRTVETDYYRLQNLMWISLCIESASNVDNPCFSQ